LIDLGGIAALGLLAAVFFLESVRPWSQRDQASQAQRRQFLALRQRAGSAAAQTRRLTQQLDVLRNSQPASAAAREDLKHLNARLSRIAALASRQGLQLRNLEPGRPVPDGDRVLLPIHLTGTADYRGCGEFLHAIRTEFADVTVNAMQITARTAGEKTTLDFDMNLRWYAAPAVAAVGN
jgi:Tfp pilus assembly protein PilO